MKRKIDKIADKMAAVIERGARLDNERGQLVASGRYDAPQIIEKTAAIETCWGELARLTEQMKRAIEEFEATN